MAEAIPMRRSKTHQMKVLITESDMEAAQQLIQLSDEDNNSNITFTGKRKTGSFEDEEVDQRLRYDIILKKKMREIFGEDEAFQRKKKQKRYRSLVNIYMETKPVNY